MEGTRPSVIAFYTLVFVGLALSAYQGGERFSLNNIEDAQEVLARRHHGLAVSRFALFPR